jgi:maltose alpha-D-glucosyltransferase / alpha-amylase
MERGWHKNAVIYCLAVESYRDGNGDGIGDLPGLIASLDHLAELGIDCLWLEPLYPSPLKDNGYDVADHKAIDPRLGTLDDFRELIEQAEARDIAVLVDLVFSHTSDQHRWFQSARSESDSPYRDYYIWTDDPEAHPEGPAAFPTIEKSPWTYDEQAGRWYFHRFYHFEPDLDISNPDVRRELRETMEFWLDLGVAGFRVDAAHFLVQKLAERGDKDPHRPLKEMHDAVSAARHDGVLLGEADVELEQLPEFFDDDRQMQLLLNFYLDNNLFLALARNEAEPVARILRALPRIPPEGQWANFLRNQDELNLSHLAEDEKEQVFATFARSPKERIYGRGIRRRLPPMLSGDRRRLELAYSLLFSMHGTPVIGYGDELGMGDDLDLPERWSVRTPMQWSGERNAGFSDAPADKLIRPVIATGEFGYEQVNVEVERADQGSLLRWMEGAIRLRQRLPQIGFGDARVLDVAEPAVLVHTCEWEGRGLLAAHNFSGHDSSLSLDAPDAGADVLADRPYERFDDGRLELGPYGYRWLEYTPG